MYKYPFHIINLIKWCQIKNNLSLFYSERKIATMTRTEMKTWHVEEEEEEEIAMETDPDKYVQF